MKNRHWICPVIIDFCITLRRIQIWAQPLRFLLNQLRRHVYRYKTAAKPLIEDPGVLKKDSFRLHTVLWFSNVPINTKIFILLFFLNISKSNHILSPSLTHTSGVFHWLLRTHTHVTSSNRCRGSNVVCSAWTDSQFPHVGLPVAMVTANSNKL